MDQNEVVIGIGGAAGDGVASAGVPGTPSLIGVPTLTASQFLPFFSVLAHGAHSTLK